MIKFSTKLLNFLKRIFKLQVNEWKIIQIKYEVLTDKKVECLPD